jgi:hypothetical protein
MIKDKVVIVTGASYRSSQISLLYTRRASSEGIRSEPKTNCQMRALRSLSAFPITLTDESAIVAAAMIGDSRIPKVG